MALLDGVPILIRSPLPPAETAARLASVVDVRGGWWISLQSLFGTRPVVGLVSPFAVCLCKRPDYHNSFRTFLTAAIRPDGSGAVLSGQVGMHPSLRRIVLGGLAACGVASVVTVGVFFLFVLQSRGSDALPALVAPPLFAVGIGLATAVGRLAARGEAAFLTRYVSDALRAKPWRGRDDISPHCGGVGS